MQCSICQKERDKRFTRTIINDPPIDVCWSCHEKIINLDPPPIYHPRSRQRTWGRWTLSLTKPYSLDIRPFSHPDPYEIELDRLDAHWKVLHWINHLAVKTWVTRGDIARFCQACQELRKEGLIKVMPKENFNEYAWGC